MDAQVPLERNSQLELRRSLGAEESDVVLVCAAFLNPRKDHESLLRAFALAQAKAPELRLWIVGDEVTGHEGMLARLQALADELGISSRVVFTGLREDVPTLLQAGDVCVLASREEAMPLSIAEAQMAGRPVVATNVGDVATMVPEGRCGFLVEPGDNSAMAEAMARLARDADLRRKFGKAAKVHAERLYSGKAILPQIERIILRVAGP